MGNHDKPLGETAEYITAIAIDESSLTARTPELEHERQIAVRDLIEWNHFSLKGASGPYSLTLKTAENRVAFALLSPALAQPVTMGVPLAPFRGVIRDYSLICESYFEAVKTGNLPRIEAIDMSRRALHNEGAQMLKDAMSEKTDMDGETSRRLFTLLFVLHLK